MIRGIGIDLVDIERFSHWHQYQSAQLQRIFSIAEIAHCLEYEKLRAGRFAVRFAAREAFFKAIQAAYPKPLPFLTCCKAVYLSNNIQGAPHLTINWELLATINPAISPLTAHVSLSHSKTTATAIVILEN